jgi:hypothetical protein
MGQPFEDGRNCLEFSGEADLIAAIEKVLIMSNQEIEKMRGAVWDCYNRFIDTKAFGQMFGKTGLNCVLVNAEEKSVPWSRESQIAVGAFMEKYAG